MGPEIPELVPEDPLFWEGDTPSSESEEYPAIGEDETSEDNLLVP